MNYHESKSNTVSARNYDPNRGYSCTIDCGATCYHQQCEPTICYSCERYEETVNELMIALNKKN